MKSVLAIIACVALWAAGPVQAQAVEDMPVLRIQYLGPLEATTDIDTEPGSVFRHDELDPTNWGGELEIGNGPWRWVVGGLVGEDEKTDDLGDKTKFEVDRIYLGIRQAGYAPALGPGAIAYVGGGVAFNDYNVSDTALGSFNWSDEGLWLGGGVAWHLSGQLKGATVGIDFKWFDEDSQLPGAGGDFDSTVLSFSIGWSF